MSVIKSTLNTRSEEFKANAAAMQALVEDLREKTAQAGAGGTADARAKHPPTDLHVAGGGCATGKLRPPAPDYQPRQPLRGANGDGRAGEQARRTARLDRLAWHWLRECLSPPPQAMRGA